MTIKKPSKKIIILIVCAFIVISLVVYNKIQTSGTSMIKAETAVAEEEYDSINYTETEKNINALDTDGDGLPDWQEIITNTDPHNTDTDRDGTTDAKELELDRDPAVAGPNDRLDKSKTLTVEANTNTDVTISEEVSKNLFANAVYLSNNDGVTEENVATLVDNLINGVQDTFTFKEYMLSDLPVIQNPTKDDLRFFASTYTTLQIALLEKLAVNTEPEAMAKIYNDHAKSLYMLKTPSTIGGTQLQAINNFSKVSAVFDAMSKQKEDPLKLPLAVRAYQDAAAEQPELIKVIGEYLNKNDIINSLDGTAKNYWTLSITE